MPRRNNQGRRRRQPVAPPAAHESTTRVPDLSYEQMARELVKVGKCSIQILDYPQRFTSPNRSNA